jgi:hypothetical protein
MERQDSDFRYDMNKVDDCTLALLHLVMWQRIEGHGSRAWKGFDWATMDRLHEKGFIGDPRSKARSVEVTEEGCRIAEELFGKLFRKAD